MLKLFQRPKANMSSVMLSPTTKGNWPIRWIKNYFATNRACLSKVSFNLKFLYKIFVQITWTIWTVKVWKRGPCWLGLIIIEVKWTFFTGRETGTSTSSRLAMDSGKKWIQLVSAESSPETGFVSDQSHKSQKKQQTTKLMGPYNQLYSRPSLISRNALLSTTVNVSNF